MKKMTLVERLLYGALFIAVIVGVPYSCSQGTLFTAGDPTGTCYSLHAC